MISNDIQVPIFLEFWSMRYGAKTPKDLSFSNF
jgi:hypothetical protein